MVNGWLKSSYKSGYKFEQKPLNEDTRKVLDDYFSNEYLGYDKLSLQTFRNKIIAKLRDNEVIISSSSGGYKIPSTEKELYDFVNHGKSIIMPMSARLKTCNDVIRMGTNGEINLFEKAEYHSLAKMFGTTEL